MSNSGRGPLGWLLALILVGAVVLWWQLADEREPGGTGAPSLVEVAPARVSDTEPLVELRPPTPNTENARALPDERAAQLVVSVVAPPGITLTSIVRVELRETSGAPVAGLELSAASLHATLDCRPGEYELEPHHPGPPALGAWPQRVVLPPGATRSVDLRLAALRCLQGSLTDEHEQGLEDVRVALEREDRVLSEVRTLPGGTFAFPPLPEGDYALELGDRLSPLVPRRILHLDAALGRQDLRIPVLLELEVRVVDEQGLAVAGAEVEGVGEKGGRIVGVSDADGRVRGTQLPPGNYRVFARHPDLGRGNRIFVLTAGDVIPVEIRLLSGRPR